MVEITQNELEEYKFYHNVYVILNSFATWKQVPANINIDYKEVNSALRIMRNILSLNE